MRIDFLLQHEDNSFTMVEVKTVVDSEDDFLKVNSEDENKKNKGAVFPFGKNTQKFDGYKVVSKRAIKHISELTLVSKKLKTDTAYPILNTCVLFIVVRGDCQYFRPHNEVCPVFAQKLKEAESSGVKIIAHQVEWIVNDTHIFCTNKFTLPVLL